MNPIKSILIIFIVFATNQVFSQYTDVINSNRPGVSQSAFSVGTNVVQFEVSPYMIKEERTPVVSHKVSGYGADFSARYGLLLEELEINIDGTYQNDTKTFISNNDKEKRSNFKYLCLGVKYLIYDPYKNEENNKPNIFSWKANHTFKWKSLIPAIAIYTGVNYDFKDNPYITPGLAGISPKVMIATQNNFSGGWVLILNIVKDRIGTDQSDLSYTIALTHSFSPKWAIFVETQGIQSDFYADNLFRFGAGYLWSKNFQLDTALTFNTKNTPSVLSVNLGMSYRLDFHKDKEVDNGTSAKEEGNRRSNKNKKKKKDRLQGDTDSQNKIIKQKKDRIDF